MSKQKTDNAQQEWDKVFNTKESHQFISEKSAEMLKKFKNGELQPMENPKDKK